LKARDVEAIIARHPEIDIRSIQLYIAHHGVQQCYTSQNPDSGNVTLWIEMYRNFTDLDDWLEIVVHAYPRFRPNFEASRRPGEDQATFLKRLGYDARAADKNDGETLRNEAKKIEAVFRFFFSIAAMSPDRLQRYAVPCIENLLSAEPVTYDLAFIARDFLRTCGERMKQVDSERLGKIIEVMRRRIQKVTGDPMLRFLNMPATRINQAATQLGFPPPPGWAPAK
jgi:hypothetical protein